MSSVGRLRRHVAKTSEKSNQIELKWIFEEPHQEQCERIPKKKKKKYGRMSETESQRKQKTFFCYHIDYISSNETGRLRQVSYNTCNVFLVFFSLHIHTQAMTHVLSAKVFVHIQSICTFDF